MAPLSTPDASTTGPSFVDITWMSIANVYYQVGPLKIITDGYFTRIPQSEFYGGGGGLAHTHDPLKPDAVAVGRVRDALGGASAVNLLLTGHSHYDHAFDTATWAGLTGAPILGSKTTCYQAIAQKIPTDRCTVINGGERLALSDGVTMRVVRWNHSGDSTNNPEQHDPVELQAVPTPDPVTGGLYAGVADAFPNGGGGRGFLFTVDGPQGRISWFYEDSASAADLSVPIVVDGVGYGAPLANLEAALGDAGLTAVDLWIGTGGKAVAELVIPVLKPKAYLPIHWDNMMGAFQNGVASAFADAALETYLGQSSVTLIRPRQYMDKWRLDRNGVVSVDNGVVKQALGFCTAVTSCPTGDNCGTIPNGCAGTVSCGPACVAPLTCGGGGMANVCGCTPLTACAAGKTCGTIADGCGGLVTCGPACVAPQTCGGGGMANVCGCTPLATCPAGKNCGTIANDCGGLVTCGPACTAPQTCGGGGTANVCGCTPSSCQAGSCGSFDDGCGGQLACPCASGTSCVQARCVVLPDGGAQSDALDASDATDGEARDVGSDDGSGGDMGTGGTGGDGGESGGGGTTDGAAGLGDAGSGGGASGEPGDGAGGAEIDGSGVGGTTMTGDGARDAPAGKEPASSGGGCGCNATGTPGSSSLLLLFAALGLATVRFRPRGCVRRHRELA